MSFALMILKIRQQFCNYMKCLQMTIVTQALQRHFVKIGYDKAMKKEKQTERF
jgi:hypothetical protein